MKVYKLILHTNGKEPIESQPFENKPSQSEIKQVLELYKADRAELVEDTESS